MGGASKSRFFFPLFSHIISISSMWGLRREACFLGYETACGFVALRLRHAQYERGSVGRHKEVGCISSLLDVLCFPCLYTSFSVCFPGVQVDVIIMIINDSNEEMMIIKIINNINNYNTIKIPCSWGAASGKWSGRCVAGEFHQRCRGCFC